MSPLIFVALLAAALGAQAPQAKPASSSPLRIVVIAGEDSVNVIQQKSAVAPIIEVRDRNDQPVAGATVRFAIQGGRATFNGARAVTVTTNAVGQATATGLTPTGAGALQIGASATFQGQTAAVTITQANVMTAAEAAAGGTAATSGSAGGAGANAGAGGTAAGGGGGMSATTIGIVGAAVAGGAVAATQVVGGGGSTTYSGPFSGQTVDVLAPNGSCAITVAHTGKVDLDIVVEDSGSVSGTGSVEGTMQVVAGSAGCPTGTTLAPVGSTQPHGCCDQDMPVSGSRSNITFTGNHGGNAGTNWIYDFTGTMNSDTEITGTFTLTTTYQNNSPGPSVRRFQITLRKQ